MASTDPTETTATRSGNSADDGPGGGVPDAPGKPGLVLTTLIIVATVANLPLAVANVALPDIGLHFDASQTQLNLVAVGYSLGLAASVLWFGAVGDRYGRKQMMIVGVVLSAPMCLAAAWAPTIQVLIVARILGGVAAGMAYPTTLSLITALWAPGPGRTRAIALWSAIGGGVSALGPLIAGLLLENNWWGSVFLVSIPLVVVAVPMGVRLVPAHVHEETDPVDHLGGVLSAVLVGSLILAINFAPVPDAGTLVLGLSVVGAASLVAFWLRQRRARNPLYDLHVATRRTFWIAACAGIVVFGSLMGAMFIGQQFLQNVLGYSTIEAGLAILPAAVFAVLAAPRSAKLVEAKGSRFTLLFGYVFVLLGFLAMLVLWKAGIPYWKVGLAYACVGLGVGLAGTPASRSLTGSVPVTRAGMASGTADLQRDLGGAIMQSVLGALLTAGYASAVTDLIGASPAATTVSTEVQGQLTKSFSSAATVAKQYPEYADQIIAGARQSFVQGQDWAYLAGIVAVLAGAALVFFMFPRREAEQHLLETYHAADAARTEPLPGT
ncbi:MAG: MFS transporter [Acidimicrobiia bacterium]|nr:MFS transporter [Acidimicrobiia bacterium]